MYCMRKLRSFGVNSNMLVTFYNASLLSYICSSSIFGSVCWGGNISKLDRGRLEKIVKKKAKKKQVMLWEFHGTVLRLYTKRLYRKLRQIVNDPIHPVKNYFNSRHYFGSKNLPLLLQQEWKIFTPENKYKPL